MATKNIQMNILTNSGSYDTLYPQTTASQAGARPSTWTPTASQVGALPITGGTLTGDLKIKNSSNYGTTLSFGDGTYCQISELVDDCMDIKAKKINFTISDTSDSRFTINNVNPFGANGDLGDKIKILRGSRYGIGTVATTSSSINFTINFGVPMYPVLISMQSLGGCVGLNSINGVLNNNTKPTRLNSSFDDISAIFVHTNNVSTSIQKNSSGCSAGANDVLFTTNGELVYKLAQSTTSLKIEVSVSRGSIKASDCLNNSGINYYYTIIGLLI